MQEIPFRNYKCNSEVAQSRNNDSCMTKDQAKKMSNVFPREKPGIAQSAAMKFGTTLANALLAVFGYKVVLHIVTLFLTKFAGN